MKVLIIGSGGREHALAWKIAQSSLVGQIYTAPGNGGTAALGENIQIAVEDVGKITSFALETDIDLVVIGPEAALEKGLTDALQDAGISVFGPSRAAARIETSKSFAKNFMQRHGIPTARFATFRDPEKARAYLQEVDYPVVIKASGLAAGKGVLMPETLEEMYQAVDQIMTARIFGSAGDEIVVEERLAGEEVSLLAFTDGTRLCVMPPTQDHKRLQDGDQGPNTGGMGAFAPANVFSAQDTQAAVEKILQPAVDGLRQEGMCFVGVLYAGLILSESGTKVLEFNARFGDPETQVILPLLENDLLAVMDACVNGKLEPDKIRWRDRSAMCVVMVSGGYPHHYEKGIPIQGLEAIRQDEIVFHAGTSAVAGQTFSAGGRVVGVTGLGDTLNLACKKAYHRVESISFEGAYYRKDIGFHELQRFRDSEITSAYTLAGVDIDAGNRAVELMKQAVKNTYNEKVLAGIGSFGGLYDANSIKQLDRPVLVASTDGVGTKVKLAAHLGLYNSIGEDLVNHCINDILVQGARPLFFLDYFASASLDPEVVATVVKGVARGCRQADIALLGGETAEMPGIYVAKEFDLAGTIVGVVEKRHLLPHDGLKPGDVLIGFRSSGPHTNGYSLIRKIIIDETLEAYQPVLEGSLANALMATHRSYLEMLIDLIEDESAPIKALAHLTGGAFYENIPRILPDHLSALIHIGSWPVPAIFSFLQQKGKIEETEMYRVFNMGIGMLAVVDANRVAEVQGRINEPSWVIGSLVENQTERVIFQ